jgi:tetratricopeptide (TPR) repeat protein
LAFISPECWSDSDRRAIRAQVERIVASGPFAQSRRRQQFLEYIVHETLVGRGERLKGYSIALEVFGRPETFDPVADPIVRIEAGRLRDKLRCYYDTDGANDPVRIVLPRGSYRPVIAFWNGSHGLTHRSATRSPVLLREEFSKEAEAQDALLTGLGRFWHYTREACAEAQGHFARAVEIDPRYAAARAWLARTHVWQSCMNWVPLAIEPATEHAHRAVEIDPRSVLGRSVLGKVKLYLGDRDGAIAEAEEACALDSDSSEARMFLAFILAAVGRGADALRNIETAMLLQPHPSSYYFETLGLSHFALGDYDGAVAAFLRGIDINPSYIPCHYELAVAYGVQGRSEEAREEAAIVKADCPGVSAAFILDPVVGAAYRRGKEVAGLA